MAPPRKQAETEKTNIFLKSWKSPGYSNLLSIIIRLRLCFTLVYGDYHFAQLPDHGAPVQSGGCVKGRRFSVSDAAEKIARWLENRRN